MSRFRPALLSLALGALLAGPSAAQADTYTVDGYTSCGNTNGYTGNGGYGFQYQLIVTTDGVLVPGRANPATAQLRFKRSFTGRPTVITWPNESFTARLPFADGAPTIGASGDRSTVGEWGSGEPVPITITVPADGTPAIAAAPLAHYSSAAGETRSPVDGMVVLIPERRYGDCLSNESVILPTAAPAGTVKLTETAACAFGNGGGNSLTYELTVTSPALRNTDYAGTAQLRFLSRPTDVRRSIDLSPGEGVEATTVTIGRRTFDVPAINTGRITAPAQPARWVNGPAVPIVVSSTLGDMTVPAKVGPLKWSIGGGMATDRVDGITVLYGGYEKTCTPVGTATIQTQSDIGWQTPTPTATPTPTVDPETPTPTPTPETPTPTPTPTPGPEAIAYTGGAVATWGGGAKGASASAPSKLQLPAAPNGTLNGSTLTIDPLTANLKALGFLPVAVKATLTQAGASTGLWRGASFDLTVPSKLAVASTKFLGLELVSGRTCQTRTTFPLRFTATGDTLASIVGSGTVPPLTSCGASTFLASTLVSGRFSITLLGLRQS